MGSVASIQSSTASLSTDDWRGLLRCVQQLSALDGVDDFHAHAVRALRLLLSDDWVASEVYEREDIVWKAGLVDPKIPGGLYDVFRPRADENPMLDALRGTRRRHSVMTWTSAMEDPAGHERLPIYHDFYRKLGIHQQAAAVAVLGDGTLLSHGFSRDAAYGEAELALLHEVLPHLENAYGQWRCAQTLRLDFADLAGAVDAADRPLALLDGDGGLRCLTPAAERLLTGIPAGARRAPGSLPAPLRRWVARALGGGAAGRVSPDPGLLGVDEAGRPLRVRLLTSADGRAHVLVFLPPPRRLSAERLCAGLGLRPRLGRLLHGLLGGESQKEIARRSGLTYATVRSYTKEVYATLGVSRREALAGAVERRMG